MIIVSIIVFIIILTVVVFIHELGHFTAAKKLGVDVEEFGLGIPPRAFGKKIGETLYSINWLPLGGFVKLKGEDFEDYSPKDKTSFMNKKPWQKSIILVAGVTMNILLAIVIFYFTLFTNGWMSNPVLLLGDYEFAFGESINMPNVITYVAEDSPAKKAGVEFGDRIVKMSFLGEEVTPIDTTGVKEFVKDKGGKNIFVFTENINSKGKKVRMVTPEYNDVIDQAGLGVGLNTAVVLSYTSTGNKLLSGVYHSYNLASYSMNVLGNLVKTSINIGSVSPVADSVTGPIGAYSIVKLVIDEGGSMVVIALLELTALLSLSIAIMNLLPIPALDGGRLMFVIFEWVSGKKPSKRLEEASIKWGFLFLIGLLILITIKDVIALF